MGKSPRCYALCSVAPSSARAVHTARILVSEELSVASYAYASPTAHISYRLDAFRPRSNVSSYFCIGICTHLQPVTGEHFSPLTLRFSAFFLPRLMWFLHSALVCSFFQDVSLIFRHRAVRFDDVAGPTSPHMVPGIRCPNFMRLLTNEMDAALCRRISSAPKPRDLMRLLKHLRCL